MLKGNTLNEIRESQLKCVKYEIGLFLSLLSDPDEIKEVIDAASVRDDYKKILGIANNVNKESILNILNYAGMTFKDVSFESQNDEVGPADIVIYASDRYNQDKRIGISVKYDNDVIYNYTGRDILTNEQITNLKRRLPEYGDRYLEEMIQKYNSFEEWYRIRFDTSKKIASDVTNEYINLVRDEVINRWTLMSQEDKDQFLYKVYRTDSPLDYWIYNFQKKGKFILCTNPPYIRKSSYSRVTIEKIAKQYIGFFLDGKLLGKTQVKFNNGIFERYTSKKYKDAIESGNLELANEIARTYVNRGKGIIVEGKPLRYGDPINSWNFEICY